MANTPPFWRPLLPLLVLLVAVGGLYLWLDAQPAHPPAGIVAAPLAERRPADGQRFKRLRGAETGLNFKNELREYNRYQYITNGSGLAVGDYDGDGLPDLYLVSQDGPNKLFRQVERFRFEDVTTSAGGIDGGAAWGTGASFVDIDNDGDLDLYACNLEAPNKLYRNRGDGTFEDAAAELGLDHAGASIMAAFSDYDRDGDLDLYLLKNRVLHPGFILTEEVVREIKPPADTRLRPLEMLPAAPRRERGPDGHLRIPADQREHYMAFRDQVYMAGQPDVLFRNDGGRFVDATAGAGIQDYAMGLSAVWWDFDDDGWPDLYVGNDLESPDTLYRNQGDGTFAVVTGDSVPHTAYYGMGSDFGDVNNDGRLDYMVADMSPTTHFKSKIQMGDMTRQRDFLIYARPQQYMRNAMFLNTGTGRFLELARMAGVSSTDWTWSVRLEDLDDDGWIDVFVTNGIPRFDMNPDIEAHKSRLWQQNRKQEAIDLIRTVPKLTERNIALRNDGKLHFERVAEEWGLDHLGVSQATVIADIDRDGDLDVLVSNLNEEVGLYENRTTGRHSIAVALHGVQSNRFGIGARIRVESASGQKIRECALSRGFMAGQDAAMHVGLGDDTKIDRLTVWWPSGACQEFADLPVDQRFTITEPAAGRSDRPRGVPTRATWFEPAAGAPVFTHREREFDDFEVQFLLPHKLSQLGPGHAWGDADGDGDEDLFVGGAAGQGGALFIAEAGGFRRVDRGPWRDDAECEDMGVLWLDADGDGDQDLYVVSGGVEAPSGDPLLRDRLYRNGGDGTFARADDALPDVRDSGSSVAAADFDRDGDLDLFIGGRTIAGQYPLSPSSRILRNEGGRFVDVTTEVAPGLGQAGMVTGAVWSDADGDGDVDLVVAAHFQPVQLFVNEDGRLVDGTAAAGLKPYSGWWNGITAVDWNGDGAMDYLATNFGRNHKYKASAEHPTAIYYGDFDADGRDEIVETKFEGDRMLPVRGRSCSSQDMPFIAQKFETYEAFASATLADIYPADKLQSARKLEATFLYNALLLNDGHGAFTVRALPKMAQVAPAFGVVAADFDGDGRPELATAENFYSPEPETGRMAGGLGAVLDNDGAEPRWLEPALSGVVVPEDAKGAALCDLDGDHRPDLTISTNDGPLRSYHNAASTPSPLVVRLRGVPGNPTAVGARVTVRYEGGTALVVEVLAGSGYLSQSTSAVFAGRKDDVQRIDVRWPDGTESSAEPPAGGVLEIAQSR